MSDLDKLIEAVEAGRKPSFPEIARGVGGDNAQDVEMAFEGKLDAAKRLHDALLPGWKTEHRQVTSDRWHFTVSQPVMNRPQVFFGAGDPARAWLLAILRAVKTLPGNGASNATAARPGSGDA